MRKRFVRMSSEAHDAFLDFINATKNHEEDKDLFLEAARLKRQENTPEAYQHKQIMAAIRWGALVLIVIFLCLLVSCEATGIIKAIGNM